MWPAGAIRTPNSGSENLPHLVRQAVTAERAKFDMVFLADGLTSSEDGHPSQIARFEPLMVLTAFAHGDQPDRSRRHGLDDLRRAVPLARAFASLDHISQRPRRLERGDHVLRHDRRRTSASSIRAHADRYAIAEEFIDVVRGAVGLAGTTTPSRTTRRPASMSTSRSAMCSTTRANISPSRAPLNTSRPPQGHPIIVQSGSSEPGQQLAARTADVVFTAQQSLESAQAFYRELEGAARVRSAASRSRWPSCRASCRCSAAPRRRRATSSRCWTAGPTRARSFPMLSDRLGHDVSRYDLDGPLPELPASEQLQSRAKLLTDAARRDNLTLRQLAQMVATGRGHLRDVRHARADRRSHGRNGSARAGPTASTSCRPTSPAASMISAPASSRSCKSAACSAPSTRARPCATISACRVRRAVTAPASATARGPENRYRQPRNSRTHHGS